MADHVFDMLSRCLRIIEIEQTSINKWLFLDDSEVRDVLDAIMGRHNNTKGNVGTGGPKFVIFNS